MRPSARTSGALRSAKPVNQPADAAEPIRPASSDSFHAPPSTATTLSRCVIKRYPPSASVWKASAHASVYAPAIAGFGSCNATVAPRKPTAAIAKSPPEATPYTAAFERHAAPSAFFASLAESSTTPSVATRIATADHTVTASPSSATAKIATCSTSVLEYAEATAKLVRSIAPSSAAVPKIWPIAPAITQPKNAGESAGNGAALHAITAHSHSSANGRP